MAIATTTAEMVNDLVQINNDRIEGYTKAIDQLDSGDTDLKALFMSFITQSQEMKSELQNVISSLGVEVETGTTMSGDIYRTWMDARAVLSGDDRQTALEKCEFGEDAAQKAYRTVLESEDLLPDARVLVTNQKMDLKSSHDKVKLLRDNAKL